ncbi:hypothetical protein GF412_05790 [Candidatus Micrarchaeota archaeon]|nr:hypothetical protein [Candidatus Micrarchaeota archaeon]MBD3418460.1 hypothetical protein [Candidatus Micrarchaeota archaeon]
MRKMCGVRKERKVPKIAAAALSAALGMGIGGCGKAPQCQVYYRGQERSICTSFLNGYRGALRDGRKMRMQFWELEKNIAMKKKGGKDTREEEQKLEEMKRGADCLLKEISSKHYIKSRIDDGEARAVEMKQAVEELGQLLKSINKIRKQLVEFRWG